MPLLHPEHQYLKSLQLGVKLNQQVTLEVQAGGQKGHVQNKYTLGHCVIATQIKSTLFLSPFHTERLASTQPLFTLNQAEEPEEA